MPASDRVKEEKGGEPENLSALTPPHLGELYRGLEAEIGARMKPEAGPAALFAESLSYELNRSVRGAAQLIGAEGRVSEQAEPQQATDFLGQNVQMLGRAAGGLLPMLGLAIGTRYGFGKVLAHEAQAAEHALLKRTTVGLSAAESGATGLLYGALLTPTEGAAKDDLGSFAFERARSGASSGLAFALMSAGSIGLSKLASTEIGVAIGAEKLMRIGAVNGIVSGIPGGIANVEADSLVRTGKLDFDKERLGRSMYEMVLFGGTFGLGAGLLGRARATGNGMDLPDASTGRGLGEAFLSGIPKQHRALNFDYSRAVNDNYLRAANDNFQLPNHAQELKMAVGDDRALLPEKAQFLNRPAAPGAFSVVAAGKEQSDFAAAEAADGTLPAGAMKEESSGAMTMNSEHASGTSASGSYSERSSDGNPLGGEALGSRTYSDEAAVAKPAEGAGKIVSSVWTRESLVKAISEGRDLSNADLRGLDLRAVNFAGIDLEHADFTGSNLNGAVFSNALSLFCANFSRTDLAGAEFSGGALKLMAAANFEEANLTGANLSQLDLEEAVFRKANLAHAKLTETKLQKADFSDSNLTGADFTGANKAYGVKFGRADLSEVNFSGVLFQFADFEAARNLRNVNFDGAQLTGARFNFCDLTGVDFSNAVKLLSASFIRTNLDGADFTGRELRGAKFARAMNLDKAKFTGADLYFASFLDADVSGVDFTKVGKLTDAKFGYGNLAGADFSGLALGEAQFMGAKNVTAAKFDGAEIHAASFVDSDLTLSHYFSKDSDIMQRLKGVSRHELTAMAKFICVSPVVHKKLFEREMERGVSENKLSEERFLSLAGLEKIYGEESPVVAALTKVESDKDFLPQLEKLIRQWPGKADVLVAEKALSGATAQELSPIRLAALIKLDGYFSSSPGDLQKLLELERKGTVVLSQVSDFIQENPEAHKQIVLQELENHAAGAGIAGEFDYGRLKALSTLVTWVGKNTDLLQPLLKLEREGLPLSEVAELLNEDPVKQAHVQTLIAQGGSVEQVRNAIREDAVDFADRLCPADAEYMKQLRGERLRTGQLSAFIADNPTSRLGIVEELIQNRATLQRIHDQMNLAMLPDDVASRLLDSNTVAVPQIIGPMRNWNSGAYFRELLIEKVRAGETISRFDIEALSLKAQEMSRDTNGAAQATTEPDNHVSIEDQSSRDALNQSRAADQAKEAAFPITNPRAIEAANIIEEAIEQILKEIPEGKTIVVLGRDALPLYPALRSHGRDAQYFLWSRLQEHDDATGRQWLREVGPGAVVIDTGYAGSIPDAIRKIDPTASAYLLSSASQYPQLLRRNDHQAIVNNLEYFPKLVARSRTYTEMGGAVARLRNTDEHDDGEMIKNRWTVESMNRQFLRAIGLDEWGVWRYSQYAGLTPAERLGLNTQEEVNRHYARVKELRAASAGKASP